jgi:hypothetical protein
MQSCQCISMKLQVQETTSGMWSVSLPGEERVIGVTATLQISMKCRSLCIKGQLGVINKVVTTRSICHTKVAGELGNSMST